MNYALSPNTERRVRRHSLYRAQLVWLERAGLDEELKKSRSMEKVVVQNGGFPPGANQILRKLDEDALVNELKHFASNQRDIERVERILSSVAGLHYYTVATITIHYYIDAARDLIIFMLLDIKGIAGSDWVTQLGQGDDASNPVGGDTPSGIVLECLFSDVLGPSTYPPSN